MEYNRRNSRLLSLAGSRGAYAKALEEIVKNDKNVMVMTADLGQLTGISCIADKYPQQYVNIGIAEQNMIGVAAGMAKDGWNVYATTYANFLTMRAYEQIRINLGYMQLPVKLVGSSGGLGMEILGNTHYAIEDMALMRAIPGMTVISPADGWEIIKAMEVMRDYNRPVYLRLSGEMNYPIIYKEDYEFRIGHTVEMRDGEDITLFATGTMVFQALRAADILEKEGIRSKIVNVHTIKPLEPGELYEAIKGKKLFATIEEHSVVGGLGSAVLEALAPYTTPKAILCGVPDTFLKVGCYPYLLEQCKLLGEQIAETIQKEL